MNRFAMRIHSAANVSRANRWLGKHLAICAALIAALLACTPATWAQENATVTGTVADSTGAVVPNATVNLTNPATGQTRTVTSNDVGAYRFANVGIGTYNLEVTATGFAKFEKTGIVVTVAQTVEANATLNVGAQAATVTVAAQALQVQTETSEVSTLISGQQVARLSTNGRNIVQLAALGMGVANTLASFGGVNALTSANGLSFNGTRTTHNVYLLDGGELNDRGCGGCYMVLPSQDAIAEFKTLDSNYSPDYGIGSGGTITMVIKSGSRSFHGELYEFNRNTAYNANDYFNKQANRPRPKFQLNEPGGNIGGPLWIPHVYNESKTRTFFFVNEEWRRLIQGSAPSVQNTVMESNFPTAGQSLNYTPYTANPVIPKVPNLPNNPTYTALETSLGLTPGQPFPLNTTTGKYTIPVQMIDPNVVLQLKAGTFPKPNMPNGYQYTASPAQPTNVREDAVRIDHAINSKFQLMGHFVHDAVEPTFFPPLWQGSFPTVGTTMQNPSYSSVIKLTQTYSPNLLNETAFNYSGNKIRLTPIAAPGYSFTIPSGWTATSFFPLSQHATNDFPAITFSGKPFGATWSESYFPWKNGYEGFQYRDDLSWIKGRHQFKFGFSWLHTYKNQQLQANTQGTANFDSSNANFSGDAYVDFMLGLANTFTQLNYLAGKHWVNNNYGFYANDNWHVNSRLVLNLGFRYDGMPHAFERYNRFANFVTADYNTTLGYPLNADGTINPAYMTTFEGAPFYLNGIRQAGVNGFPRGNVNNDYLTWQPRIGFAYDLFGNGKTVLRGGFGTFYERVQGNDVYNAALNPPFAYQPQATNVLFSNPHTSALTGQTSQQSFPSNMTTFKMHYPNPATATYSLGFQHEVGPSIVGVLQYVGSDGWNQNNNHQINTLPWNDLVHRQQVAAATTNTNLWRTYPGFSSINQQENTTHFNYNSLQAGLRVENRHGATATFAYTWSHLIDINANDNNGTGFTAPFNPKYDRGSDAGYDHRHMFNASYVYDFPFFPKGSNRAAREILGGWSVSGVTMAQVGTPIVTSLTGINTVGLGNGGNRPNLVSKVKYPKTQAHWFDKTAFATPTAPWNGGTTGGYGTAGKDAVVGPGLFNWNLSLFKIIPLTPGEGTNLELRFESFNTFNHTNFTSVNLNSGDGNFGAVTADYAPRVLELGAKITF